MSSWSKRNLKHVNRASSGKRFSNVNLRKSSSDSDLHGKKKARQRARGKKLNIETVNKRAFNRVGVTISHAKLRALFWRLVQVNWRNGYPGENMARKENLITFPDNKKVCISAGTKHGGKRKIKKLHSVKPPATS